jgi:peptidoglycan/LPS O-acetylase OafA/YrhL
MSTATPPTPTADQPRTSRTRHLNTFDFWRLFAALSVVITHSKMEIHDDFFYSPIGSLDGVGIFFVISGMFVYRSGERLYERTGQWVEYARNRFLRIAPALYAHTFFVVVLLLLLGAITLGDVLHPSFLVWVAGSIFLAPNYDPVTFEQFGTGALNGPLWSIPAEVSFYILVPFLILAARRWSFGAVLAVLVPVVILAPFIGHAMGGGIEMVIHHTFAERGAYFVVGMFWAHYWERTPQTVWLFLAACAAWFLLIPVVGSEWYRPTVLAIPLSYAVIYAGYHAPLILQRLTHKIGDLSFGVYIWHMPVINYFLWKGWTQSWWVTPSVIAISLMLGAASWWGVERRFLKRKRVSAREIETGEKVA